MTEARTRARQRLIGALVLLIIGVVGFPVLFETEPRPLPLDTPFEIQRRNAAAPPARNGVAIDAAPAATATAEPPADAAPQTSAAADDEVILSPRSAAGASALALPPTAAAPAQTVVAAPPATVPSTAPIDTPPSRIEDGARARALLEGGAASAAAGGRFIVQVGAYADTAMMRETRAKVEKLGLKTYTQVVENEAGKRTRVRLGPFDSRDEADAVAGKLKRSGLPANILVL